MYARMELRQLYEENGSKRNQFIAQLQELITQRSKLNKEVNPEEDSRGTAESVRSQMWITAEMDRVANELEFKAQVAELLRTTLLKAKSQRTNLNSALELKAVLMDAPQLPPLEASQSVSQKKCV